MSDNVLSSFTPTRREERAYDHTFRVGIIGTGWIAEAHAESYLNQPDVKIVALADLIPGKAEAFAKCYGLTGARCYPDHKSLLASERLDAVSVCTYNTAHAQGDVYKRQGLSSFRVLSVSARGEMCTRGRGMAVCPVKSCFRFRA